MLHEFAHVVICRLLRVPIGDVRYFSFPARLGALGMVNAEPGGVLATLAICCAPLVLCSLMAVAVGYVGAYLWLLSVWFMHWSAVAVFWLSFSFACHLLPSSGDLDNVGEAVRNAMRARNYAAAAVWPFLWLLYVLYALQAYRLHIILGFALGVVLPLSLQGVKF